MYTSTIAINFQFAIICLKECCPQKMYDFLIILITGNFSGTTIVVSRGLEDNIISDTNLSILSSTILRFY